MKNGWFDTPKNINRTMKNSTIKRGDSQLEGGLYFYLIIPERVLPKET
jgi:hypothetical protein